MLLSHPDQRTQEPSDLGLSPVQNLDGTVFNLSPFNAGRGIDLQPANEGTGFELQPANEGRVFDFQPASVSIDTL